MQLRDFGGWKLCAVLMLVVLAGVLAACGQSGDNPSTAAQVMSGQALLEARCVQCHGVDRVTNTTKTVDGWQASVDSMVMRGATLNAQEIEVLVAYLAEEYGQ
jgi:mono/diheme cytochrome c family protein